MKEKKDMIAERVAVEMVQDAIHRMMNNQMNPDIRQSLISIGYKIGAKLKVVESTFSIEEINFDAMINRVVDEWVREQMKAKNCRLRRATEDEIGVIEGLKIAHEQLEEAHESFDRWEKIREALTKKMELALRDHDGLFYANGRIVWRKNEKIDRSQKTLPTQQENRI